MKKNGIQIGLKAGERLFVNGAVLRVDRKVSIELMNDVSFLLESHVIQPEDAKSPVRQLYFIIQTMLMDPYNIDNTKMVFEQTFSLLMVAMEDEELIDGLKTVSMLIEDGRIFEALKSVRALFSVEDKILAGKHNGLHETAKREVA